MAGGNHEAHHEAVARQLLGRAVFLIRHDGAPVAAFSAQRNELRRQAADRASRLLAFEAGERAAMAGLDTAYLEAVLLQLVSDDATTYAKLIDAAGAGLRETDELLGRRSLDGIEASTTWRAFSSGLRP